MNWGEREREIWRKMETRAISKNLIPEKSHVLLFNLLNPFLLIIKSIPGLFEIFLLNVQIREIGEGKEYKTGFFSNLTPQRYFLQYFM